MLESVLAGGVIALPFVAVVTLLVDTIRTALRRKSSALATGHGHRYRVVGAARHREALNRLLATAPDRRLRVSLVPDRGDSFDPDAVAVLDAAGTTLAYLPAEDAASYGRVLTELRTRGIEPVCRARLVGGGIEGSALDLRLDLDQPLNIARRYRITVHHAGPLGDAH
jgi:hypothetical protein